MGEALKSVGGVKMIKCSPLFRRSSETNKSGKCRGMPGNAGECWGMLGNAGECWGMPGNAGECPVTVKVTVREMEHHLPPPPTPGS